jgi:DNA-binding transcriptional MocR family regulator
VIHQYGIRGARAKEIVASVEGAIRNGRLRPGDLLPPVRQLADELRISTGTVASAYRDLQVRGLTVGRPRQGTRVAFRPAITTRMPVVLPTNVRDAATGVPDPRLLPPLRSRLKALAPRPHTYGDAANDPALVALAQERFARDGIDATHLTVLGGALDAIERLLQAHLRRGDRIAVEDPGYSSLLDLFGAMGLVPDPVALDELGMRPESLRRSLRAGALACILTPRAQNPTGAALDARRARELRSVLEEFPHVVVIEDDHAGAVAGTAAHSVVGGSQTSWATVRSVSKSLGPDLRLSVVAGDAATIARVDGRRRLGAGWVSGLLQQLVIDMWRDPEVDALVERAAGIYARRRGFVETALADHAITVHARSGFNVWIPVVEESPTVAALLAHGWAVSAGERCRIAAGPAIRVTIAQFSEQDAKRFASALASCLRPHGRSQIA